jgi:hypothetical protein
MIQFTAQDYRCENCGELYPLKLQVHAPRVVGGIHAPHFQRHGPGCTKQVFIQITPEGEWAA